MRDVNDYTSLLLASPCRSMDAFQHKGRDIMRSLFQAILRALVFLARLPSQLFDSLFGGSGIPMPPDDLPMPTTDEVEVTSYQAQNEERAKDSLVQHSPAVQAYRYASAEAEDRHQVDLNLLGIDQKLWLRTLDDVGLRIVAASDLKKIDQALNGEPFALPSLDSVGQDTRHVNLIMAERIATARSMRAGPERHNVLAV
jgi:hypothetical protein